MDRDFEVKLIIEVEAHKCLYAKTCPEFKDRHKKNESWGEIATVLGVSVVDCRKKWENLRDSLRAYFKNNNKVKSGSGASKNIKWVHFEAMSFLVPFIKVPVTFGNFAEGTGIDERGDENVQRPLPSTSHAESPAKKRSKSDEANGTLSEILKAIENVRSEKVPSAMSNFFVSLALQAEHLTREKQLRLQMKCLQALHQVEFDFEETDSAIL